MSLADYPTLDVVTLRAVACELRSGLLDQVSALADAARATARSSIGRRLDDASLDALAQLQDFAREVSDAIAAIGREATRREEAAPTGARRPLLSDWIRACEGTALGPMTIEKLSRGAMPILMKLRGAIVQTSDAALSACMYSTVGGLSGPTIYATPADLRAALDRLAAVHAPSGARLQCSECGEAWDVCLCVPL